jgi:hypothetical protein
VNPIKNRALDWVLISKFSKKNLFVKVVVLNKHYAKPWHP